MIPHTIRAGDTVKWRELPGVDSLGEPVTSDDWTLKVYLRTNVAAEGATLTGAAYGDGWEFTLPASTSAGFDAGTWYWSKVATQGSEVVTLETGTVVVLASMVYTGTPTANDGRSQAEIDLASVQAAIRALVTRGAKSYSIGNRSFTGHDLSELMQREAMLKAEVNRERRAEKIAAGLGDPFNMFVRFS